MEWAVAIYGVLGAYAVAIAFLTYGDPSLWDDLRDNKGALATFIVGVGGLHGVIATLFANAYLQRAQHEREVEYDRRRTLDADRRQASVLLVPIDAICRLSSAVVGAIEENPLDCGTAFKILNKETPPILQRLLDAQPRSFPSLPVELCLELGDFTQSLEVLLDSWKNMDTRAADRDIFIASVEQLFGFLVYFETVRDTLRSFADGTFDAGVLPLDRRKSFKMGQARLEPLIENLSY